MEVYQIWCDGKINNRLSEKEEPGYMGWSDYNPTTYAVKDKQRALNELKRIRELHPEAKFELHVYVPREVIDY